MRNLAILFLAMATSALSLANFALADGPIFRSAAINAFAQSQKCNYNPQRVRFVSTQGGQEVFTSPAAPPLLGTCVAMCRQGQCEVVVQKQGIGSTVCGGRCSGGTFPSTPGTSGQDGNLPAASRSSRYPVL